MADQIDTPTDEGAAPEVDTSRIDARASVFEDIHAARRGMLAGNGVVLETDAGDGEPRDDEDDAAKARDDADEAPADSAPTDSGEPDDQGAPAEAPAPAPEPAPEPAAAPEPAPEPTYKVIVDGKEQVVPLSTLVSNYQIESTARQRLTEASETLKRAREFEDEAKRRTAPPSQESPAPAPAKEEPDYQALADVIAGGTPDQIADSLKKVVDVLQRTGGPEIKAMSPEEMEERVFSKLEFNNALQSVGAEYSDIFAVRRLAALAGQQAHALIQADVAAAQREGRPRRPFVEHMRTALNEIRADLQVYAGAAGEDGKASGDGRTAAGDPPSRIALSQDRLDRKRSAPQQPQPRSGGRPAAAEPRPKSEVERRREGISDIMRARGQHL